MITPRMMRWEGPISHTGEMRNTYEVFARKPEEKR
jgi:hypothetical protein